MRTTSPHLGFAHSLLVAGTRNQRVLRKTESGEGVLR